MASLLDRFIFDAVYDSRTLSLLLCTLAISNSYCWQFVAAVHWSDPYIALNSSIHYPTCIVIVTEITQCLQKLIM